LVNQLLAARVAAVSKKVNTTRETLRGVLTDGDAQVVFLDGPGIVPSHGKKFAEELAARAWDGYRECDLALLVMDTVKRPTPEVLELVRKIAPKPTLIDEYKSTYGDDAVDQPEVPVVLVLNKIDLALQSKHVHWRANEIWAVGSFKKTFHLSALTGNGVRALKDYLLGEAPPGPWVFPPDMVAALSKVEQVEQLVRTYLLVWFNSRLPYTVQQQTVGWTPRLDGSLIIEHELSVEDTVQARILCGVRNRLVLRLQQNVAWNLEQLWGVRPIHLHIWVKASNVRWSQKDKTRAATGEGNRWLRMQLSRGAGEVRTGESGSV
jgi:GTP-binding protein Era